MKRYLFTSSESVRESLLVYLATSSEALYEKINIFKHFLKSEKQKKS